MAYSIYGEPLQRGHCEVHPDTPHPYPCPDCFDDVAADRYYANQRAEYEEQCRIEYERYQRDEWYRCRALEWLRCNQTGEPLPYWWYGN